MSASNKQLDNMLIECNAEQLKKSLNKIPYVVQILNNTSMISTEISQNYSYDYVKTEGIKVLQQQYKKYLDSFNRDYKIIINATQEEIDTIIDHLDSIICNLEDLNVAIKYDDSNTDKGIYDVATQVEELIGEYTFDKCRILITRNQQ